MFTIILTHTDSFLKYCFISVLLAVVRIDCGMVWIINLYIYDNTTGDLKV